MSDRDENGTNGTATARTDRPPAFPTPHDPERTGNEGMSLRDWFAGQALVGYAANARVMDKAIDDWNNGHGVRPTCVAEFLAGLAYEVADAMLAAREGGAQ